MTEGDASNEHATDIEREIELQALLTRIRREHRRPEIDSETEDILRRSLGESSRRSARDRELRDRPFRS